MTTATAQPTLASLLAEEEADLIRRQQAAKERCKHPREGLRHIVAAALPEEIWHELGITLSHAKLTCRDHDTYLDTESRLLVGENIPLLVWVSACSRWDNIEIVFSPAIAQPREAFHALSYHHAWMPVDGTYRGNLALLARALYNAIKAHRTLATRHPELLEGVR